jgi:uncharacterized membrane protein
MPELAFQMLSVVFFAGPMALAWFSMRRAGRAVLDAERQEAALASMLLQSTRAFALRNWLATIVLSVTALAFFLHTCGLTGLVLWSVGFLPVLLSMMFTMLLLMAPPQVRRVF